MVWTTNAANALTFIEAGTRLFGRVEVECCSGSWRLQTADSDLGCALWWLLEDGANPNRVAMADVQEMADRVAQTEASLSEETRA
jgi:hypothetical protein